MKNIDIEVVSKESVKPSASTPPHLRHHQLSFLDQIKPTYFMPIVLFYFLQEADDQSNLAKRERCVDQIKKSLFEALVHFYPLAGRVKSRLFVDCNDEGAYFVEAVAGCQLSDVLQNPNPHEMSKFLPLDLNDSNGLPLMVQVTSFKCGGTAIGVGLNHQIGDALSLIMFLNSWSALARGKTGFKTPIFGTTANLFPPKDMSTFTSDYRSVKDKNNVCKRLVFDAPKLAALVQKYSKDAAWRPTRFEALSAFIWSRYKVATQTNKCTGGPKTYAIRIPVNIRTRMEQTHEDASENFFGNMDVVAIAVPTSETIADIVNTMRNAIKQIDLEFVKQLQRSTDEHWNFHKQLFTQIFKGEVSSFLFSSLCRFPIYQADFGWGHPDFVASTALTVSNNVTFFDNKLGDGIEAWINLKEEDMVKFEADEEVLAMFPRLATANDAVPL